MDEPTVWIAYYGDWSGFAVFDDELACLRHAVAHHMEAGQFHLGQPLPPPSTARAILDHG